jgi:hypothetical protein
MNLYQQLKQIKRELNLSFYVKESSNYCTYGYENLFWLEIVLCLLNQRSLREKVEYLRFVEDEIGLANFYKAIGLNFKKMNKIPNISTFSRYKKAFTKSKIDYSHLIGNVLQKVKERVIHLSIDGKDIRNSGNGRNGKDNVKSIHVMFNKYLLYSDKTRNENHWIKHHFKALINTLKYHDSLKEKDILFTGDCIYNTHSNRQAINENGCLYLLPFKSQYKQFGHLFHHKECIDEKEIVDYNKNSIFTYHYTLYKLPNNEENIQFLIKINKTLYNLKTKVTQTSIQNYITNHTNPNFNFFKTKLAHWNVETYHQKKDMWLLEDRYHKSPKNAYSIATINNFIAFIYEQMGIKKRNKLKTFALKLQKAIFAYWQKIYATLLIIF